MPKEGVTSGLSQNLAKKTVTAIKKWKEGTEKEKHVKYRQEQLQQDPPALLALEESLKKNQGSSSTAENLNYTGVYFNLEENDREWQ